MKITLINKNYLDILDSKQDFLLLGNSRNQKGFLYEFNYKSGTKNLSTNDIKTLLYSFRDFSKIGKDREGFRFTVHFTGIISESSNVEDGFEYFKLIIGLSTKKTLTEIEDHVSKLYREKNFSDSILLSKRIIKNKSDVNVEKYLDNLNTFLQEKYPSYLTNQVTFEGVELENTYKVVSSSYEIVN